MNGLILLKKYWHWIVIVVIAAIGVYLIYNAGYTKAQLRGEMQIAGLMQAAAEDKARAIAEVRGAERANAAKREQIDAKRFQEYAESGEKYAKTVADLNAGNIRLRKQVAQLTNSIGVPADSPSPGVDRTGSGQTDGFGVADALAAVRVGDAGDQARIALKACVDKVNADREMYMTGYRK